VVDDHSSDATLSVLATLRDPRLSVVVSPADCRGVAAARNYGATFARSDILAFQDSDDIWLVDKLKNQVPLFDTPDVVMVCSSYLIVDRDGGVSCQGAEEWMLTGVWEHSKLYDFRYITPTWLIRRSTFFEMGGFEEAMRNLEDWEFAFRAFSVGKIRVLPSPTVVKRGGDDSLNWRLDYRFSSLSFFLDKHKCALGSHPLVLSRLYTELGLLGLRLRMWSSTSALFKAALSNNRKSLRLWWYFVMAMISPKALLAIRRISGAVRRLR
tara:strand:- start:755 stop:1558 length:804 start_codon:yes stop_codon:yes gene_type:complete